MQDLNLPNLPPLRLERTHKAICVVCKNLTHVKNAERKGGLCDCCKIKMKLNSIGVAFKKYKRRRAEVNNNNN